MPGPASAPPPRVSTRAAARVSSRPSQSRVRWRHCGASRLTESAPVSEGLARVSTGLWLLLAFPWALCESDSFLCPGDAASLPVVGLSWEGGAFPLLHTVWVLLVVTWRLSFPGCSLLPILSCLAAAFHLGTKLWPEKVSSDGQWSWRGGS